MQTQKQWRYSVSLLCDKFACAERVGRIPVEKELSKIQE